MINVFIFAFGIKLETVPTIFACGIRLYVFFSVNLINVRLYFWYNTILIVRKIKNSNYKKIVIFEKC